MADTQSRRSDPAKKTEPAPSAKKAPAKKSAAKKVASTAAKATPQGKAASVATKVVAKKSTTAPKRGPDFDRARSQGEKRLASMPQGRKWLLAEFLVCVLLLGLAALTGKVKGKEDPDLTGSRLAIKGSALAGVFVVLGLVSAGGRGAEKAAGAFGAVITLAYVFQEGPTFKTISAWAKKSAKEEES